MKSWPRKGASNTIKTEGRKKRYERREKRIGCYVGQGKELGGYPQKIRATYKFCESSHALSMGRTK